MDTHPQQTEEQTLDLKMRKYFQDVYDFDQLIKVKVLVLAELLR